MASLHRQGRRLLPEVRSRRGPAVRRPPDRCRDAHERPGGHGEPLARAGHDCRHSRRQRLHADGELLQQGSLRPGRSEGVHDQGSQRQAVRRRSDRRRPVQLLGGAPRYVWPRRPRRAVDSGRHRRERSRGGAPDQPRGCDAADGAQLLPPRRGRLPGAGQSGRSPVGLPVHRVSLRAQGHDRESEARRVDHQGAHRGHQALLRRQGVRGEGIHRPSTNSRKPTCHVSTTCTRRATSSSACRT